MVRLGWVLVLMLLAAACNSQTSGIAPRGTLGLAKADWDRALGSPKHNPVGWEEYEGGKYVVMFMDGNVWRLERIWDPKSPVTMDAARTESKLLMPDDAVLVKTYTAMGDRTIDLYKSQWLMDRFKDTKDKASLWVGGESGNFIVLYRAGTGKVTSIVMGLGDNP